MNSSFTKSLNRIRLAICCGSLSLFALSTATICCADAPILAPTTQLTTPESKDQDDFCVWVHPSAPAQSVVVASDKSAGRVFVYDLDGRVLQTIIVAKPGNIDIRQGVQIDGRPLDIVVVNQRADGFKLVIFQVNPATRQLDRIDDNCLTGQNYGGCLYHSRKTHELSFVCTSETGVVEQYALRGNGKGGITAAKVRTLNIGKCEGAVADDQVGSLFIAEEKKGVWKFDAEPSGLTTGTLIAAVGSDGLTGDVEGLALYRPSDKESTGHDGYLLVSDQGRNRFVVYQREAPHQFVGEFGIDGASQTDGIEVCSANLGSKYPQGLFACHTDRSPRWVLLTPWQEIAPKLSAGQPAK